MRRYTLEECYAALDIHPKTFRRWIKEADITPTPSRADERVKYLTEEELKRLADVYDRPWPPQPGAAPEIIPVTAYKQLRELVNTATSEQVKFQTDVTELRGQQEATAGQLDAIGLATRELAEHNRLEHETFEDHWKTTSAALNTFDQRQTAEQQETQQRFAGVLEASTAHEERLDALTVQGEQIQAALHEQQETTTRQFAAVEQASRDQAARQDQAQASLQSALTQHTDQLGHIQDQAQHLEKATQAAQGELAQQQKAMQQETERQAEHIRQLTTRVGQQGQRIAQLTEQVQVLQSAMREQAEQQAGRLEGLSTSLNSTASIAEAARTEAGNAVARLSPVEQALTTLETQFKSEQDTRAALEQTVTRLTEQTRRESTSEHPQSDRKKPGSKSKDESTT